MKNDAGKSSDLWVNASAVFPARKASDVIASALQIQRRLRTRFSLVSFFSAFKTRRHLCRKSYSIVENCLFDSLVETRMFVNSVNVGFVQRFWACPDRLTASWTAADRIPIAFVCLPGDLADL